ncbi:hypothetical protein HAV15_010697 [Penicillium sp. str. |nr:hypothetical protein HAV15_010697 [Penicillium sp. str. \
MGHKFDAVMLAGLIGTQATSSGAMLDGSGAYSYERRLTYFVDDYYQMMPCNPVIPTGETGLDSIQPVSGWLMYEKEKPKCAKKHKAQKGSQTTSGTRLVVGQTRKVNWLPTFSGILKR